MELEISTIIKNKEYDKLTLEHMQNIIRTCQICKENKTLDNFPISKSCLYGRSSNCKPCFNKKYYKKNVKLFKR